MKDCPPCAGELRELQNVGSRAAAGRGAGAGRRLDRPAARRDQPDARRERTSRWRARVGRVFDDMHLVWIGLASTAATFLCGAIVLGMLQFASPERARLAGGGDRRHGGAVGLRSESRPARRPLSRLPSVPEDGDRAAHRSRAARSPTACPTATACSPCRRSSRAKGDVSGLESLGERPRTTVQVSRHPRRHLARPPRAGAATARIAGRRQPRLARRAHDGQAEDGRLVSSLKRLRAALTAASVGDRASRRCSSRRSRG